MSYSFWCFYFGIKCLKLIMRLIFNHTILEFAFVWKRVSSLEIFTRKLPTKHEINECLFMNQKINWWCWTLGRPRGQRECCTERGRKVWTLSLPWKARKPLFFYSSSHPCFALYLFSFAPLSVLFSMEHLGPKRCQCCGYTHTHTQTHTHTHKDTPGHKSASWKETSSSKGPG